MLCCVVSCSQCTGDNPMAERNYPCDNFLVVYFGSNATQLNQVRLLLAPFI